MNIIEAETKKTTPVKDDLAEFEIVTITKNIDINFIHDWVTLDYAKYWGMSSQTLHQVVSFYRDFEQNRDADAYIGFRNRRPAFLLESYDPSFDPISHVYTPEIGDRGMHILLAPNNNPESGFSFRAMKAAIDFLFMNDSTQRIVVEPDVRNWKIHRLNRRVGFCHIARVKIESKDALLAVCSRENYEQAKTNEIISKKSQALQASIPPKSIVDFIRKSTWLQVNRHLIKKAISELAHEKIIEPELVKQYSDGAIYRINSDSRNIVYQFNAEVIALNHWIVKPNTIERLENDKATQLDAVAFVIEFSQTMKISCTMLPTYLEEITSTLRSSAFKIHRSSLSSRQLVNATFQQIESAMTEGHPSFIANNGRIGFDAVDYQRFAPEAGETNQLIWLAAHKSRAEFSSVENYNYALLLEEEFDLSFIVGLERELTKLGLASEDYFLIPVHPWQWFNKLSNVFAGDLATGYLVCLGNGEDFYQAQQSIRTFFNQSNPEKHYIKTALSILNMGFIRGLSADYMAVTPAINDWVYSIIENDPYFQQTNFTLLREVAAIGYRSPHYENELVGQNPYRKMLSALWRESPLNYLQTNERVLTMAALLHVDNHDIAFLPELIAASAATTESWIKSYLYCYLSPLLHCYFKYDLVFMPHGENLIMRLKNNIPVGVFMKDIGEEVCLLNSDTELPEKVQRIAANMPKEVAILAIFTDIFDGFFRYLSQILRDYSDFSETVFWKLVAQCVIDYQAEHPELDEKFESHDLFEEEFLHSCLNRLQLKDNQQMIDLADPAKNLRFSGKLTNPIAAYRNQHSFKASNSMTERDKIEFSDRQANER